MKNSLITILVAFISILFGMYLENQIPTVQASATKGCDFVNSTGDIDVYYCVDNYTDFEFYINSYGFMMPKSE